MRTHLFSGDVEGDLLGDFLLEDVEDFEETSRRETAEDTLLLCYNCYSLKFVLSNVFPATELATLTSYGHRST